MLGGRRSHQMRARWIQSETAGASWRRPEGLSQRWGKGSTEVVRACSHGEVTQAKRHEKEDSAGHPGRWVPGHGSITYKARVLSFKDEECKEKSEDLSHTQSRRERGHSRKCQCLVASDLVKRRETNVGSEKKMIRFL